MDINKWALDYKNKGLWFRKQHRNRKRSTCHESEKEESFDKSRLFWERYFSGVFERRLKYASITSR